jgi:thiamine kinase-like enzyme
MNSPLKVKIFLCKGLSDLKNETVEAHLFNKDLLINLLTLKIKQPNQFKKIVGGYSNNTYHYERENLILRFPKLHNLRYRYTPDNSIETHNLLQAKQLNLTPLEIVAYYTKYALLVTRFVPSFQLCSERYFKDERNYKKKLTEVAQLIKKLHYSDREFRENKEASFPFISSSSEIFKTVRLILTAEDHEILKKLDSIKSMIDTFEIIKRPSHGDLHYSNLIEINDAIQLIDWESSSVRDPAYDISRFLCSAELNPNAEDFFLKAYKNSLNIQLTDDEFSHLKTRIQFFKPLIYFSVVVWAKYTVFHCEEKRLFEEAIKSFTEKTLNQLKNLPFPANHTEKYKKTRTHSQNYVNFFSLIAENEPTPYPSESIGRHKPYSI